jgi:predicted transcriptional regulator
MNLLKKLEKALEIDQQFIVDSTRDLYEADIETLKEHLAASDVSVDEIAARVEKAQAYANGAVKLAGEVLMSQKVYDNLIKAGITEAQIEEYADYIGGELYNNIEDVIESTFKSAAEDAGFMLDNLAMTLGLLDDTRKLN